MVKKSRRKGCECHDMHRFGPSQRSRLHGKKCDDALLRGEATVPVTIRDKVSPLWQKGASGRQLREGV